MSISNFPHSCRPVHCATTIRVSINTPHWVARKRECTVPSLPSSLGHTKVLGIQSGVQSRRCWSQFWRCWPWPGSCHRPGTTGRGWKWAAGCSARKSRLTLLKGIGLHTSSLHWRCLLRRGSNRWRVLLKLFRMQSSTRVQAVICIVSSFKMLRVAVHRLGWKK